jgi:hypothetical protein
MILPTKHIRSDRALLTVGGNLLDCLHEPMTVSRLWDDIRNRRADRAGNAPINYDWFVLALDLLFMIGSVHFDQHGLLRRGGS